MNNWNGWLGIRHWWYLYSLWFHRSYCPLADSPFYPLYWRTVWRGKVYNGVGIQNKYEENHANVHTSKDVLLSLGNPKLPQPKVYGEKLPDLTQTPSNITLNEDVLNAPSVVITRAFPIMSSKCQKRTSILTCPKHTIVTLMYRNKTRTPPPKGNPNKPLL